MDNFIELIKGIGFIEGKSNIENWGLWTYNDYRITIVTELERWSISKRDVNPPNSLNRIPTHTWLPLQDNQRNFSVDEIKLLEEHFKLELRDLKLKQLGV